MTLLVTGANSSSGYQISRSVRLRQAASAYFNRTPSSNGNRQIMTFSFWMKRGLLTYASSYLTLFSAYPVSSSVDIIAFSPSSDSLRIFLNGSTSADLITTQVFRDPSAWYHVVVAIDTTQATASNRIKMYVNGSQITSFSTATYPTQNYNTYWNSTSYAASIGANLNGPQSYFDGYLTEINFIDGQALTPSSFGATSTTTGVWGPAKYTGTYGTNGFYLNFLDNSNNTATTIGKDYSGNGNNWTPNNISVTTGATYDSMVDTPTPYGSDTGVGGEVRGNYCVMNPVAKNSRVSCITGNLQVYGDNTANHQIVYGTFPITTGKWYWEATINNPGSPVNIIGIQSYIGFADGTYCGSSGNGIGWGYSNANGNYYASNFTTSGTAPALPNGTIGIAYDADAGKIWFRTNTGSWHQGDPAAGTSPTGTLSGTATTMMPAVSFYVSNGAYDFNFGQRAFSYTAPTGFKALCTQNLPTPTIANGALYMAASLYTGNGTSLAITNTVGTASFQPDFVWVKDRSAVKDHILTDAVRGVDKTLFSSTTDSEQTSSTRITSFNSNGFSVGNALGTNTNADTYVGWQWKAGGSSSSNTSGSITSTVNVNTTAGFSVVTYTGNGGSNQSVGHGLGVTPGMVIIKDRTLATANWLVHHQSQPTGYTLYLNLTNAQDSGTTQWGSSAQTSSVFYIGFTAGASGSNNNGDNYVAYCFAPIAGYSAFGSWTNNNSTNGTFTYLGFRPRLIILKNSDNVESWYIWDSSRQIYNVAAPAGAVWISPNSSSGENSTNTSTATIDLLSNGFKIYTTNPAAGEVSFGTRSYIYAAFAENPFKYALAR